MEKVKKIFFLFLTMFKIGLVTFGGGYAMVAVIESEVVEKKGWIESEEFYDMLAIAESTPGPIAINSATYIGYKIAGFFGSLFATLAVCLPSFIIIYVVSLFFEQVLSLKIIAYAFSGIQVGIVYLLLSAGLKMLKKIKKTPLNIAIFSVTFVMSVAFSIFAISFSSIFYILISGLLGAVLCLATQGSTPNEEAEK